MGLFSSSLDQKVDRRIAGINGLRSQFNNPPLTPDEEHRERSIAYVQMMPRSFDWDGNLAKVNRKCRFVANTRGRGGVYICKTCGRQIPYCSCK